MADTGTAGEPALRAWALAHARSVGRGGTHAPTAVLTPGSVALQGVDRDSVTCMDICAVPDGPLLVATGHPDGVTRVWDGQTGHLLRSIPPLLGDQRPVRRVMWNTRRDQALLVIENEAGSRTIRDGLTAALLRRMDHPWYMLDLPPGPGLLVPVRGAGLFVVGEPEWNRENLNVWGPQGFQAAISLRAGETFKSGCGMVLPSGETIVYIGLHNGRGSSWLLPPEGPRRHVWPDGSSLSWPSYTDDRPLAGTVLPSGRVLVASSSALGVHVADVSHGTPLHSIGAGTPEAMDWLVLPGSGCALLAVGYTSGRVLVYALEERESENLNEELNPWDMNSMRRWIDTYPGIRKVAWCMTADRQPMVALICTDLSIHRIRVPLPDWNVPEDPPRNRPHPGGRPPATGTSPRSASRLHTAPTSLVALGKADLHPPLSLIEDLVTLTGPTGRTAPDTLTLHDPGLRTLTDHPGITRLRQLAWPVPARVGLAGLLAAEAEQPENYTPPTDSAPADRVDALREALATEPGTATAPATAHAPLLTAAETITDRLISLLTVLGPDAVEADPALPLLLAHWAAQMPQLDQRQLRLLAPQRVDGTARTRTTAAAPGTSGISNRGTLTHLLPTQLALPAQLLLLRHSRHELLYRLHVSEAEPHPEQVTLVLDTSPPTFGPAECLLRAAAHLITTEFWRHGRHPFLVTFDAPHHAVALTRPVDLPALWTSRTLQVPDVSTALATAAATGVPAVLLTHHRLPRERGLQPGPRLRMLTTHVADDVPVGRWALPFHRHVPPSPEPAQLRGAIAALLAHT